MSVHFIAVVSCNMPILDRYRTTCLATFKQTGKAADARREARAQEKWRQVGGFDLCGEHAGLLYRKHSPRSLVELPEPDAGVRIDYKDPDWDRVYRRWRSACSCGWKTDGGTAHPYLFGGMCSESRVNQIWMDVHVAVDVVGRTPQWTVEELERRRRESDEWHARMDAERAAREAAGGGMS